MGVEFNPAKISSDRFVSIIKEIEGLDDQHELEIVELNVTKQEKLKGEESGYAIHVREKPNFFEWILRILWRTPDTVRVSNVGQFLMSFVEKNQEVFYKLDEGVAKGFIDKTSHHFSNYPEIEKTISVAFGIIVHQQHMIQEFQIDREKLIKDNTLLTKNNKLLNKNAEKAIVMLEEYENNYGTLKQIKENIENLDATNEEFISLTNKNSELQTQVEENSKALEEIEAKKEAALQAQTKAEQEAKELDAAKLELAKTKQESEEVKVETRQQLQQALKWEKEINEEHQMLQTEARNTVRQQYMVQAYQELKDKFSQVMKQQEESIEKFKEEKIRAANREADKIILQAKQEAEEKILEANRKADKIILQAKQKEITNKAELEVQNLKDEPTKVEEIGFGW